MIKSVKKIILVVMSCMVGLMTGCGGGGGGGGVVTVPAPGNGDGGANTIVNGTASKGIIYPGTVKIFAVEAGVKSSTPLNTVQTDQDGKFTADLGKYKGPIVIEAAGQYKDEATAKTVTIDAANPLHAAINDVSSATGEKKCAVTPLTDLAYSLIAGSSLTKENIEATNSRVADIFKLTDITGTEPVRPEAAVLSASSVTDEQRVYTIALATLSQMAKDAGGSAPATFDQVKGILGNFKDDMAASPGAGLAPANISAFTAALGTVTAPTSSLGGFDDASSKLQNISRTEIKLTLSVGTAPAGTLIGGIQGTIALPPGTSIRTDGDSGELHGGVLDTSGNAKSSLVIAKYSASTRTLDFALVNASGFTGGDFATLQINIQTGVSATVSDFKLSGSKVIDTAGSTMNIAVTVK